MFFLNYYYYTIMHSSSAENKVDLDFDFDLGINDLIRETQYPSLRILLNLMKNYNPPDAHAHSKTITDSVAERERCQRFGFEYAGRKTRRRIFFGGLIADDSWHPIAVHAAEAYKLYYSVSFIESSATLSTDNTQSRKIRFTPDSVDFRVLSGIFGPSTKVTVDLYADYPEEERGSSTGKGAIIIVEDMQRERILERWKENGMAVDDIGIVGDADEVFTRDFLLAAQSCDVPNFRPGQDCRRPKLVSKALIFESSPECATAKKISFHPDMIIGECIDGIGNSDVHKPGKRAFNGNGRRIKGYGLNPEEYSLMPNTTMFPLWKPLDFRSTEGGAFVPGKQTYTGFLSTCIISFRRPKI